jgi:hypothetical protein
VSSATAASRIVGLFHEIDERTTTMAEGLRMTAAQLADKLLASEHADLLRESVAWIVAELMEAEVAAKVGVELGARTPARLTHRNGYRARAWDTRVGELELHIPRLRTGSYFPSFLEPRRRGEQALVAVVQEAYVNGVSTRRVDRLVEQLGIAVCPRTRCPGVPRAGHSGAGVSGAATGGPLPLPVAGCQGGAGPRARRGPPQGPVRPSGMAAINPTSGTTRYSAWAPKVSH